MQVQLRQKEHDVENLIRENRNLRGTFEIREQGYEEIVRENNHLKEQISEYERSKLSMRSHLDKMERELRSSQTEITRL